MQGLILAALVLATVIAVAGTALGAAFSRMVRARVEVLMHLATGALLGITAFDILPEAKAVLPWGGFLIAAVAGYALLWTVGRFVFFVCPSCAISESKGDDLKRKGSLILLASALGIHCIFDGLAIAAGPSLSARAELGAFLAVGLHKLPEGLALGFLLVGANYSPKRAIWIAAGIEALTIVGGLAALAISVKPTPTAVGAIFAVVGGGFVYLVTHAFRGAFTHGMELPRSRWLTVEALSFGATGFLFWFASQF
jgi:zinc transporter ZupT